MRNEEKYWSQNHGNNKVQDKSGNESFNSDSEEGGEMIYKHSEVKSNYDGPL